MSKGNLKYMRKFAEAWPEREIVQRTVAQIPWRSNLALLDKLEDSNTEAMVLAATIKKNFEVVGGMTKLSKRLPDDNEKLQPLVGEISWGKNLILMAGSKDNPEREFYHAYRDLPKVQPFVAQIGWYHNLIIIQHCKDHLERELEVLNAEAATLATTIKKNFEELGI